MVQKNATKHLVGNCPECGFRFLPFVGDLDIPMYKSKKVRKAEKKKKEKELKDYTNPQLF